MLNVTRLKQAIQSLRDLNRARGELSKQLAALKARYTVREKVVDNLYDYYDLVSSDYFAVFDNQVTYGGALKTLLVYMSEHQELLEEQINTVRTALDKPLNPVDAKEKLDMIKSHVYYMKG